MCSLFWGHLEKWLIQFWNPLLMGTNHRICDFPIFSVWCNNSKACNISYIFSAPGAPKKVVDRIFESCYSLGTIVWYAISRIFQHGRIIPVEWRFIAREIPVGVLSRDEWRFTGEIRIYLSRWSKMSQGWIRGQFSGSSIQCFGMFVKIPGKSRVLPLVYTKTKIDICQFWDFGTYWLRGNVAGQFGYQAQAQNVPLDFLPLFDKLFRLLEK